MAWWVVEISLEPLRDVTFDIEADTSPQALSKALGKLDLELQDGEMLHFIHVSRPSNKPFPPEE